MPSRSPSRFGLSAWLLAGIVVIAAAVRVWGLDFGLPHTQARPDETYIIDVSLALLRGTQPPPHYDYPWFFVWMSTALYLAYFVWGLITGAFESFADLAASWPVRWAPFFLLNRWLSASLGTATVLIVYALGRRLCDRTTGLVAAFFLALAYIHGLNSHFGTTDVSMTFFIMLSVALLLKAHETNRRSLFVWAGLVGGFAAGTKYNAVVLAIPMVLSQVLLVIDAPGRRLRALADPRTILLGVPCAFGFAISIPFAFYDFSGFMRSMELLRGSMETGSPELGLRSGWIHHLELSLRYGIGVPLLAAGLAGMVVLLVRDWRRGTLFLAFPIAYYAIAGGSLNQFFRYILAIVPFLCVTAAYFVRWTVERLEGLAWWQPGAVARRSVTAVLATAIVAPSAVSLWQFDRIMSQTDNRVLVAEWFAAYVSPGSSVVQSGSQYGHAQLDRRVYRLWVWDRRRFLVGGQTPTEPPDWILLQESPLPSTTQPEIAELLKDGYAFAWRFDALALDESRIYDRQDAFFVPFAGFDGVTRPGPNFTLYKRIPSLGN